MPRTKKTRRKFISIYQHPDYQIAKIWRKIRWGEEGVYCPYCGSTNIYKRGSLIGTPFFRYYCNECKTVFNDLTGTPLEGSTLTVRDIIAIAELMDMNIGVKESAEIIGVSDRTITKWRSIFLEDTWLKQLLLDILEELKKKKEN